MQHALLQVTPAQIALVVSVLTILGFMVAVLKFMFNLGGKVQNMVDKFDTVTSEISTNKTAADKTAADLIKHCDDDKQHVNVRLAEFQELVLNKRLDEMGQKLNLLLLGNHKTGT